MTREEMWEKVKTEHDPCETCGYAEGSPFCLKYCPYDADRKKEQEPCDNAISRDAVKKWVCKTCPDDAECQRDCDVIKGIDALPFVAQKSGKWRYVRGDKYSCSKCGTTTSVDEAGIDEKPMYKFCPYCGAKMIEPQESEE